MSATKSPFNPDAELSKGLKVSVGLHVAIFVAFTIKAIFFAPEPISYQSAIRVDMVALPDKMDPNQALPSKKEESKPETKAPEPAKPTKAEKVKEAKTEPKLKTPKKDVEAVNLNKEKNKQKAALEKLKTMSALDEIRKEVETEKKKMAGLGNAKTPEAGTKIKGNVLSPGTELKGLNKLQHDNYLADLDHQIKQNWFLPQWLSKKPLRAQVRVKIDEKGQVLSREIVLSSGNSSYDDLALETIDKSAPFAPPPEKFVSIVAVNGLLIGFPE